MKNLRPLIEVIVMIIKIIVNIYDLISLPVHIIFQRPWTHLLKENDKRARQINPDDPHSPWIGLGTASQHFTDECLTVDEVIRKSIKLYGRENQCLGYREIINEEIVYVEDKPITKYTFTDYKWITYGHFDHKIDNILKGLLLTGVKSGDNVMIFADTSIDWFICAQSILRIGATVVTLYTSINDQGIIHSINESEVTHVLTSHRLLSKLFGLKNEMPKMSTIIYFNNGEKNTNIYVKNQSIKLISLSELETMGQLSTNEQTMCFDGPKEDDIAFVVHTSGSTGVPKGVKISHKNFIKGIVALKMLVDQICNHCSEQIYIAYLPLAHMFELGFEYTFFVFGIKIGYSSPNTLTDMGTAIRNGDKGDISLLKPTIMNGVPLILDRIRRDIYYKMKGKGVLMRKLFEFLIDYKSTWSKYGFDTPIVNYIFCQKFRRLVGGKLRVMIVGGASLSEDTHKLIKSCLNIKLIEIFGASEIGGCGLAMNIFENNLGRVGAPLPGSQVKLIDWEEGGYRVTDKPNPRGEIVLSSESISVGYIKLEEESKKCFYSDASGRRWFTTGDIGEVFPNGTFKIIDRKRDFMKLKSGVYVSLGKIESELKSNEFVDNICVYGHLYHSYLVALIVPNQLSVLRLAKSLEVDFKSCDVLYKNERILHYITDNIRRHGKRAQLNKYENPEKIILCTEVWTPDIQLLTPAMKLRRKNIANHYQKQIDLIYNQN